MNIFGKLKKVLPMMLILSMLLSTGAMAAEAPSADYDEPAAAALIPNRQLFISQTKASHQELTFLVSSDVAQLINAAESDVTWTLTRLESYANPGEDDEFYPIYDETEMYPNEKDVLDLATLSYSPSASASPFAVSNLTTTLSSYAMGLVNTLTLSFDVSAMGSRGNDSAPHANGGSYLDYCGSFTLTASVDGQEIALNQNVTVEIKPYESFHTMWEIYDQLVELALMGDDNAATPVPYALRQSMGTSTSGYDMPYLIVAKDSSVIENWLNLCERAETEPEKVMAELEAGTLDFQVPVMYSNIHANEAAAPDAIMEFANMLMTYEEIGYKKLTGLTEAGQAKLDEQREAMGLHIPELVADKTSYLGAILPETSMEKGSQNSGKVENFDAYYDSEQATVNVSELLDEVFFILVPEENVEGRMFLTRTSSGGYDLNRDNSFQTLPETQNMQHLIATFNPVTLVEFHGQVTSYQFEPCSPPHEPNFEYDLLSDHLMTGGEAMGAAAVANNEDWQSYVIPMRDYLTSDKDGNPFWEAPWDDMSTSYTPQFAMMQGCVAYTVEMPAYSESGRIADTFAMVGLSDYVAAEKAGYFLSQLKIYDRCVKNQNTDAEVGAWLVDAADNEGAEADLFRPAYNGEGENGQFFPECYIIPLDAAHQTNLQAAYDMIQWLTRNGVQVGITDAEFAFQGETYPAGTMIVSMYQAKRAVANGVLYDGTLIRDWTDLYSEGITAFNYTRGFDQIVCAQPAAYETIAAAVGLTLDYESAMNYLQDHAKSQFSGMAGADVIISNASEDSTAAVNALLKEGKQVGMVTAGQFEGDFICSYADWQTVCDQFILTGTGVNGNTVVAYTIAKAPTVYISGTTAVMTPSTSGYIYTKRVTTAAYNYDRMAMDMMNFTTTADAAQADAVIGATALDASGLAAVKNGVPYVGYTSSAVNAVNKNLVAVGTGRTAGMDCLSTVIYPEKTLVNASYIADNDNVLYGYGLYHFTALPEGAKVLVQRDGQEPMEGFMNGDDESYNAFINGIMGFSYAGQDMNGNNINITLFANSMTNKAHQRDEYAFISNAIFASLLTEKRYESNAPVFEDVAEDAYYAAPVNWAVQNGITAGTSATTFSPDQSCTRKQAITFLWKAAGAPVVEGVENPFTDVAENNYFYNAVLWALENGITSGTSATTFGSDDTCTRAQIIAFLYKAQGSAVEAENPFTDVTEGDYFYNAVLWAVENGITSGTSATTFSPNNTCTRAQIVTFLYQAQHTAV